MKIKGEFYLQDDVVAIARELIGKFLFSGIDGSITGGIITEAEAYAGAEDKASHAYGGRPTGRTEIMFHQGGVAYIYLCYGIHSLFNVVTNKSDIPHAVLIRGIYPTTGIPKILNRRKREKLTKDISDGPGKVSLSLGLHFSMTGESLTGNKIWLEDRDVKIPEKFIHVSPRIGVDYAEEDAKLPYRFVIKPNYYPVLEKYRT